MTFRTLQNAGLAIIVILLLGVGLLPTVMLYSISGYEAANVATLDEVGKIVRLDTLFRGALFQFKQVLENSENDYAQVLIELDRCIALSNQIQTPAHLSGTHHIEKDRAAVRSFHRAIEMFKFAIEVHQTEAADDPAADNTQQMETNMLRSQEQASAIFSQYLLHKFDHMKENQGLILDAFRKNQRFSTFGLVVGILIAIAVALFLSRALNRPIQQLLAGTEKIAQGELDSELQMNLSGEFGHLVKAFDRMRIEVKNQIAKQAKLAGVAQAAADSEKAKSEQLTRINANLETEISERQRAEAALEQARDRAELASRSKSEFLANMSHELRTPLNHIIGFTELVVDRNFGELNEVQEEYLIDVLGSSRHLLSLINDILDLSKVEAGKMELLFSDINLGLLLENSLVMIQEKAVKHQIRVATEIRDIPETVTVDERKVKQILYNLISNAVKFTPDGGEIRISADMLQAPSAPATPSPSGKNAASITPDPGTRALAPSPSLLRIAVADTGIGLVPQDVERIFDPFEQADNSASRKFQGTGLGLSLTQKLVALHGGRIWAESEGPGRGATFFFTLPAKNQPT